MVFGLVNSLSSSGMPLPPEGTNFDGVKLHRMRSGIAHIPGVQDGPESDAIRLSETLRESQNRPVRECLTF